MNGRRETVRLKTNRLVHFRGLLLLIVFVFPLIPLQARAGELRISGTGGALGLVKRLAAEYRKRHPAASIRILPSLGSTGGIKAVKAGALDIAISSRTLSEKETGLTMREIGRTPFVFATGMNSPVSGISVSELVALYSGRTERWPDGRPVRVVLRPAAEYDTSLLKSISAEMEQAITGALAREGMITGVTDQDNADALQRIPGSIGTTTMGQIITEARRLKALALNGVKPGLDTLAGGTYPYFKTYYLVLPASIGGEARSFMEFAVSPAGREIMKRSGYQVAGSLKP
jgi:phosphate transport system substrate-binding protein